MVSSPGTIDSCQPRGGNVVPVIDRNRCEAKEDCVRVCPYHVFEIRKLEPRQRKELGLVGKLKAFAHGNRQAFIVRDEDCHVCALCVPACPERAIRLVPAEEAPAQG